MIVGLYARVSSDDQRDAGTIQTQLSYARGRAQVEGWTLCEFLDDGVSGTVPFGKRPGARALVTAMAAGEVDLVVTYALNRLGRTQRIVLEAVDAFKSAGVPFRSLTESFEAGTPFGDATLGMMSVFAQLDRDTMVQRTTEGLRRIAREGRFTGGRVPYGYRVENGRLVEHPDHAPVVRLIYELAGDGLAPDRIALELERRGIPTAHHVGRWDNVHRILHRDAYLGTWKWGTIVREIPAIVPESLHAKAIAALATHRPYQLARSRRDYALRGLLRCGECGRSMSGLSYFSDVAKTRRRVAYRCEKHRGEGRAPFVREHLLLPLLWERAQEILSSSDTVTAALAARGPESRERQVERELATAAADLAGIKAAEDRLVELALTALPTEALDRKAEGLRAQRTDVEARLARARQSRESLAKKVAGTAALRTALLRLRGAAQTATPKQQAAVLRQMLRSLTVAVSPTGISLGLVWALDFRAGSPSPWRSRRGSPCSSWSW